MPNLPVVVVWGLKATPLLIGAWALSVLLPRASAASRHFLWVLALATTLALPLVALVAPRWEVTVPSKLGRVVTPMFNVVSVAPTSSTVPVGAAETAGPGGSIATAASGESASAEATKTVAFAFPSPTTIWEFGAVLVGLLLVASLWGTARLARRAAVVDDDMLRGEVRQLAGRLGVHRHVRLRQAKDRAMPMTWGAFRPSILLPAGFDRWPVARRQTVLLHELAHVKRWDWLTQLLARVVCVVYWWHPLAWVAARRLREERELACDDLVLAHGTVPSAYAGDLLEIARAFRASAATSLAAVAMARRSQLAGRLLAVLDATRSRGSLKRSHLVPAMAAAMVLMVPLAGVATRQARSPANASLTSASAATSVDDASAVEIRPAGSPARWPVEVRRPVQARGAMLCDWSAKSDHNSSSTSVNDEHMMIQLSRDDCTLTVRADGEIAGYASAPTGKGTTFTDDDRDIARLPEHGYFEIEERSGSSRRRVEVTEAKGTFERRWFVDGHEQPYGDGARAWFGDALVVLARRAGINADARALRIFKSQGADGLIAEIAELQSDYVASKYYRVLFDHAQLSSAQLVHLIDDAAKRISSDYELGRVLNTLAAHGPLDKDVQQAYVHAANGIDSDYEHGRALGALVLSGDLDVDAMDGIFASADRIDSDYERARLLLAVAERYPSRRPLPTSYLTAVGGMSSDYERGRVLTALLSRDQLSSQDRGRVLEVVEKIGSDHTRAEVLLAVIARGALDETTRAPFFRAVNTVESSYERQRLLTAVVQSGPDETTMLAVLEAARGIDSDHSKADVLVAAAAKGLASDRVRTAYAAVAETIGSRSDRNRAYQAAGLRPG
jgi:beta-lactamase regulating signal transducer with metallopeptidase domain